MVGIKIVDIGSVGIETVGIETVYKNELNDESKYSDSIPSSCKSVLASFISEIVFKRTSPDRPINGKCF